MTLKGEPIDIEAMLAAGWVYRDMPDGILLDETSWTAFLSIIGFSNYRILAFTERKEFDGVWRRGQFLISPEGMKNLAAHGTITKH